MGRQFVEKWVLNGRDDSINHEIDTIRSGYPRASFASQAYSGAIFLSAVEYTALLSIATTKVFRLNRMIVDNDAASPNRLILYNYPSQSALISFAAVRMKIAGSQTEFIDDLDVPFLGGNSGGVYVSCGVASIWVRVQGILITSD